MEYNTTGIKKDFSMKNKFRDLSIYTKTFIASFGAGCLVSLILLILGLCNLLSLFIPLGIFLGSLFSGFSYFFLGKIDAWTCDYNKRTKYTTLVIFLRLFLLLTFMAVEVFLQIKLEIILFNPFGFLGAYLFTTFVFGAFYFWSKKCE